MNSCNCLLLIDSVCVCYPLPFGAAVRFDVLVLASIARFWASFIYLIYSLYIGLMILANKVCRKVLR